MGFKRTPCGYELYRSNQWTNYYYYYYYYYYYCTLRTPVPPLTGVLDSVDQPGGDSAFRSRK